MPAVGRTSPPAAIFYIATGSGCLLWLSQRASEKPDPCVGMAPAVATPGPTNNAVTYNTRYKENAMSLSLILLIVLILILIGALPTWGHSRSWGYGPSGGIGLVLLILVILMLMGRI